jgi:hypothetical protein
VIEETPSELRERRARRTVGRQLVVALPLIPVWIGGMLVMGIVALGNRHLVDELLLDANQIAGVKWYSGIVTYIAVLSWATAVVSACWGAWFCRLGGRPAALKFLLSGAVITSYVLADDLLQLHAVFIPAHTPLGKFAAEGLIVAVVVAWLYLSREQIARTRWLVLIGAGLALVMSIVIDTTSGWHSPRLQLVAEDGAKLLGALGWATYFVSTAADLGRSVMAQHLRERGPVSVSGRS